MSTSCTVKQTSVLVEWIQNSMENHHPLSPYLKQGNNLGWIILITASFEKLCPNKMDTSESVEDCLNVESIKVGTFCALSWDEAICLTVFQTLPIVVVEFRVEQKWCQYAFFTHIEVYIIYWIIWSKYFIQCLLLCTYSISALLIPPHFNGLTENN